jgi:type II secretory pathway component GspD/PulD (secretin)
VQESQQRVRQTVGPFLFVQDGAEGRLAVVEQSPEVVWFQQHAQRFNYIAAGVVFREVGTAFLVRPIILPDRQIRLKITPHLSYRTEEGEGSIELVDASTELVVQSGQPVTIGGSDRDGEVVRQFLLGYDRINRTGQVSIIFTAEAP